MIDVAEVNQWCWLKERGQWLDNVNRTLDLASGKPILQKIRFRRRREEGGELEPVGAAAEQAEGEREAEAGDLRVLVHRVGGGERGAGLVKPYGLVNVVFCSVHAF